MRMTLPTLAIVLGGLGTSQVEDIRAALQATPGVLCPGIDGSDQYKTEVALLVAEFYASRVVLIGHSFAGEAIWHSGVQPDLIIGLDEVATDWGDIDKPGLMPTTYARFTRDNLWWNPFTWVQPRRAPMAWAGPAAVVPGTTHNSLPHDAALIQQIVQLVRGGAGAWCTAPPPRPCKD